MEVPLNCRHCGKQNIVDFSNLESKPVDKIITVKGYSCKSCSRWEAVIFTTSSFEEAIRNLYTYSPLHEKYPFLFAKALRKARGIRERGEYNGSRNSHNQF